MKKQSIDIGKFQVRLLAVIGLFFLPLTLLLGQADKKIYINKGVNYNSTMGYFEFATNTDFNDYILELEKSVRDLNEDEVETFYSKITKKYKHNSVRSIIKNKLSTQFTTNRWSPEIDADNYFIQDDVFRFVVNKYNEIVIANKYIMFVDKCEYITCAEKEKKIIKQLRAIVTDVYQISKPKLNLVLPITNYCSETPQFRKKNDEDCCDKNDRDTYKYHEYDNGLRKMKAVFWQRNIWFIGYRRVGGKTENYKKDNSGKWQLEKANEVSVYYGGTIYFEAQNGDDCADASPFGTWGETRKNKKTASHSYPIGAAFWTKSCSLASIHTVSDNSENATIMLYLTTDCGDCEPLTAVSDSRFRCWTTKSVEFDKGGWRVGDFNGDNQFDIMRYEVNTCGADVYISKDNEFKNNGCWATSSTEFSYGGIQYEGWWLGDYNGDGKDDIMRYRAGSCGADVFLSDGTKFINNGCWSTKSIEFNFGDWMVGDFNGDGKDDLMRYEPNICGADIYLSNGNQFVSKGCWATSSTEFSYGGIQYEGWWIGDYNGDGKDDIMRYRAGSCGADVFLSDGTKFINNGCWSTKSIEFNFGDWMVGDFNGDGKDDLMRYEPNLCGAEVYLSDGKEFKNSGCWTTKSTEFSYGGIRHEGWWIGDYNGDGKDDIMRYEPGICGAQVYLSDGKKFILK